VVNDRPQALVRAQAVEDARSHGQPQAYWATMQTATPSPSGQPRFLQLSDVAEVLNTSSAQVYSLVRSGELPAIKIGGRGQWRVEASELERYIERMYDQTRDFVSKHQFGRSAPEDDDASTEQNESAETDEAPAGK
jgi:excisionase family DNA binding protein